MPLNIRINENYRLTSDSFNIIVEERRMVDPTKAPNWEKRKAKGASPELREDWKESSYHNTVEQAMNAVVDKTVRSSDAESVSQLLSEIRRIRREISDVLAE